MTDSREKIKQIAPHHAFPLRVVRRAPCAASTTIIGILSFYLSAYSSIHLLPSLHFTSYNNLKRV